MNSTIARSSIPTAMVVVLFGAIWQRGSLGPTRSRRGRFGLASGPGGGRQWINVSG